MHAYNWDFTSTFGHLDFLASGFLVSIYLTLVSCFFGTLLAVPVTCAFSSSNRSIRIIATVLVELGKGIPLLVLLVWLFYVTPIWLGWSASAFWNAVLAFSLNLAAFLADILRGGMAAIPKGHIEAAEAVGMSRFTVLKRVIIPETVRRTLPSITAFYIALFKLSTLASVIGVQELLFNVRMLNSIRPQPLETYTVLALMFVVVVIPMSQAARLLEKHPWFAISPKSRLS